MEAYLLQAPSKPPPVEPGRGVKTYTAKGQSPRRQVEEAALSAQEG